MIAKTIRVCPSLSCTLAVRGERMGTL